MPLVLASAAFSTLKVVLPLKTATFMFECFV
jgi:hypothetical protein